MMKSSFDFVIWSKYFILIRVQMTINRFWGYKILLHMPWTCFEFHLLIKQYLALWFWNDHHTGLLIHEDHDIIRWSVLCFVQDWADIFETGKPNTHSNAVMWRKNILHSNIYISSMSCIAMLHFGDALDWWIFMGFGGVLTLLVVL